MGKQGHRIRPFHRRHSITVIMEFGVYLATGAPEAHHKSKIQDLDIGYKTTHFFVNNQKNCQTSIQSPGDGIPRNVFRHGQRQREFRQLGNFFFFSAARSSDSGFLSLL
jgi:hypothetical protein